MAKENEGMPSVREHAQKLHDAMVDRGAIAPDSSTAALAGAIPTWSKGTVALDESTGRPVGVQQELPAFTDGGVAAPSEAAAPDGAVQAPVASAPIPAASAEPAAPSGKTAEEILAEHNARLAAAAAPTNGHAAVAETPAAAAGATAADEAAQAVVDAWADAEEFEFEDQDLGTKIPMRVPKQFAQSVKRGYGKMAAYDRARSYLANADPALRPLIESGQLNQFLPLIQAALGDSEFGDFVVKGYQRRQQGLPLIEQARQEAAAAGATPQYAQQPYQAPVIDEAALAAADPYLAEQMRPVLSTMQALQQRVDSYEQQRATEVQRQQQTAAQQQAESTRINTEVAQAHRDLSQMFPGAVHLEQGARDPYLERAISYAREAGYVQRYGIAAGIVFGGQQIAAFEAERAQATASPAAAAMNQADNARLTELARQEAARSSQSVGGGAPAQAPPTAPPVRPSTQGADGKRKPADQYMQEMQRYLYATRALQNA